jgi:hypothetical protein
MHYIYNAEQYIVYYTGFSWRLKEDFAFIPTLKEEVFPLRPL